MKLKRLGKIETAGITAYYLTLATTVGASFYFDGRLWGIALWSFLPLSAIWTALIVASLAPPIVLALSDKSSLAKPIQTRERKGYLVSGILIVFAILVFWTFRVKIHLLGDGYTLLGILSESSTHLLIKGREIGEALIHVWLKTALTVWGHFTTSQAALFSFQIISIVSGAISISLVCFFSRRLFAKRSERWIFGTGLMSGGYALLFFGYVENYSILVTAVIAFTLLGIIAMRKRSLLVVLAMLAGLSAWLHILGATLFGALLYAFLDNSRIGKKMAGLPVTAKMALALLLASVVGLTFWHFYSTDPFIRLAFLSIASAEFTTSGYTLFSADHLLDLLNLLFILCPWLLMCVFIIWNKSVRDDIQRLLHVPETRFLVVLSCSTLSAVCLLDPKLGMGRDWDLFAFGAIPVTVLFYYTMLKSRTSAKQIQRSLTFAISLSVVTLASRIIVQRLELPSIEYYKKLLATDSRHLQPAVQNLQDYYFSTGDSARGLAFTNQYLNSFPEEALVKVSRKLTQEGSHSQAIELCKRAIQLNPKYSAAYANIGFSYIMAGKFDSSLSYLEIADGLNPYNWATQEALGYAHFRLSDTAIASQKLRSLINTSDSLSVRGISVLMNIALTESNMHRYHELLKMMIERPDAPAMAFVQVGDYYTSRSEFELAYSAYVRAVELGADSSTLHEFVRLHRKSTQ